MRKQTQELKKLAEEFQSLKAELFEGDKFRVLPENPKTDRYNQLLGLFYPQFRNKQWRRP